MLSAFIWIISLASIALMLLRPRRIAEWIWIAAGAILLVVTGLMPVQAALGAVRQSADVCMFLVGMMLLSEVAREEGVFDWVAEVAVHGARGSAARLFLWVYAAGVVVTALLSNDATAVVLTPAVLAVARRAQVKALPYLMACALVANAASFLLPISNPANLVVFGPHMPPLGPWLRSLLAPSAVSIVATFVCLRLLFRKSLAGRAADGSEAGRLGGGGRLALAGVMLASAGLLVCSGQGIALGPPALAAGALSLGMVAIRDRNVLRAALRSISWSILPLVAGLFIIVAALGGTGFLHLIGSGLLAAAREQNAAGRLAVAFAVALGSNAMNNLPVGLAVGSALHHLGQTGLLAHAVLIGVDLGPNLSVAGSLATILWLIALRREDEEVSAWRFFGVGLIAMPLALALAILALR